MLYKNLNKGFLIMKNFKLLMIFMAIPFYSLTSFNDEMSLQQDVKAGQIKENKSFIIGQTVDQILNESFQMPIRKTYSLHDGQFCEIELRGPNDEYIAVCCYDIFSQKCYQKKSCFNCFAKNRYEKVCYVKTLDVCEEHQSKKIGTALMSRVIKHAKNEKCEKVELVSSWGAKSFYENLGFLPFQNKENHTDKVENIDTFKMSL